MTTKEKILDLFESNKGLYFSGEEIAQALCVSRAAVWKAVDRLRNEGYSISAVTNKGYCLSEQSDILSPQGIQKYLNEELLPLEIMVLSSVDSTNALLREKANAGALEGLTIVSNQQTAGRGRHGRNFFSPNDTGVYFSLLLRPTQYSPQEAVQITTMAAAAMCEAIEEVSEETPQIKWVNDIFVRGKKVCGILTEASVGLESGQLDYAILGAGLNVYAPHGGFPEELSEIAGAVFDSPQKDMKNRLVGSFLNHFLSYYTAASRSAYVEQYRHYSLVLGKPITVVRDSGNREAVVYGIDEACHLLVTYENGETDCLSYGEIQIHL